jgi:hypothetical protein
VAGKGAGDGPLTADTGLLPTGGVEAGNGPKAKRIVHRGQTNTIPAGNPVASKTYEQLGFGHLSN